MSGGPWVPLPWKIVAPNEQGRTNQTNHPLHYFVQLERATLIPNLPTLFIGCRLKWPGLLWFPVWEISVGILRLHICMKTQGKDITDVNQGKSYNIDVGHTN
jgi:hypothetical protein